MDSARDTSRLFITLWPDARVRADLRAQREQWTWPRTAAPVASAKLHLTLHFLGSQPDGLVLALADALAVPFTPFDLHFGSCAVWRHGSAVLEPLAVPDALLALHAALGHALQGVGIALEDRPFRPHVTMARRASGASTPREVAPLDWHVNGFALVESLPEHAGYTVLREYVPTPPQRVDPA